MLTSASFGWFINRPEIIPRLFALMIDEAHLLNVWGPSFRPEYTQIGLLRKRFPKHTVMLAFTATLREGIPRDSVCRFLGFKPGKFHFIQRSNARYDIKLSVKQFPHGAQSEKFPELDWLLQQRGKTVVYCQSTKYGNKILHYLLEKQQKQHISTTDKVHICTYNALHTNKYNDKTLELLREAKDVIVIATDKIAVGIDIPDIALAVIIDPSDLDDAMQKLGRAGRDWRKVSKPRGIIYLSKGIFTKAQATIDDAKASPHKRQDISLPTLVLASCKLRNIDEQYRNHVHILDNIACHCSSCSRHPVPLFPSPCFCSGCQPNDPIHSTSAPTTMNQQAKAPAIPFNQRVTKAMRDAGKTKMVEFQRSVMESLDDDEDAPEVAILCETKMESILDAFQDRLCYSAVQAVVEASILEMVDEPLEETELLRPWVKDNKILRKRSQGFLDLLHKMHICFDALRAEARLKHNQREQERRARKKAEKEQAGNGTEVNPQGTGNKDPSVESDTDTISSDEEGDVDIEEVLEMEGSGGKE
ncbi:hypothetical protein PM082_022247 [Marasmius tenuissimus]|nr:hypothetical protein PM082_022247 [Marasmius tenuissimus]